MMSAKGKPSPKKGVSKSKEVGKSSSKVKVADLPEIPTKESNVLSFPVIKISDNERLLPRYSTVLGRTVEEGVGMDDLDALQLELEALLSAVAVRTRVMQDEIQLLSSAEDKLEKRAKMSPLLPGKRTKSQERTIKKLKENPVKLIEPGQPPLPNKLMKTKSTPGNVLIEQDPAGLDVIRFEPPKVLPPKNDTPNRFWASVEPYCSEITLDDVRLLEDLIKEHSEDSEYQKIPSLGRHYSLRWAEEDTGDQRSGKNNETSTRRSDKLNDNVTTGPLTQRLISALMEENMVPVDFVCRNEENRTPLDLLKNFTVSNSANFERRVRKELEEQGILDSDEVSEEMADDEILQELKRCQAELKVINAYNLQHLKRLLKQANDEIVRQDLKKRLQLADTEVLETYRRVQAAQQKKKILSKKEQELCWKALKDRDTLLRHIDSL